MPVYSLLLVLVLGVGAPFWLVRLLTRPRYRAGLAQRLGRVPVELHGLGAGPVVWLHAVSVGEVMAATGLVQELGRVRPGWTVAISTTTEAGQRVARQRFPANPVFYLPLDLRVLVRRYLRVLQPRLLVLMESEFWPNLLRECGRSGCAVVVANARVSDRSYPRYLRLRRLWRPILGQVARFLAGGAETARRLEAIGVESGRIEVTGNLKYDLPEPVAGAVVEAIRAALPAGVALLVAGSTLEGEEAMLLEAWTAVRQTMPAAMLLLAPRRPERFDAVAAMIGRCGWTAVRASGLAGGHGGEIPADGVLLLDTIGDLAAIYGLGAAAFVGGSLIAAGGHNPLEPARFGVPVAMGKSCENFREVVEAMRSEEAIRIVGSPGELAGGLTELLRGGAAVEAMGRRGQAMFRSQAGAAARSVAAMLAVLGQAEGTPA